MISLTDNFYFLLEEFLEDQLKRDNDMISMDETGKFPSALLNKFLELITTGVLKLMPGNPRAPVATIESTQPLATIPISSLNLEVSNYQLRMTATTPPKFTTLKPGTIGYWMIDCRQIGVQDATNNGYITGDVSFTGSSLASQVASELQLNTLLISAGDGGKLSEIMPVQFSIKLG